MWLHSPFEPPVAEQGNYAIRFADGMAVKLAEDGDKEYSIGIPASEVLRHGPDVLPARIPAALTEFEKTGGNGAGL